MTSGVSLAQWRLSDAETYTLRQSSLGPIQYPWFGHMAWEGGKQEWTTDYRRAGP